jgi:predicted RNase H-like HicB family nuclease
MMKNYVALFETVPGTGGPGSAGYGVVFPDFPGCISAGDTYEEALRMAHEALSGHVACMKKDGDPVPEPRTLAEIKATWEDWNEWNADYEFVVGYVTLLPLKTTKRVNVVLEESLLTRIDQVTNNRSAFISEAAKRLLEA